MRTHRCFGHALASAGLLLLLQPAARGAVTAPGAAGRALRRQGAAKAAGSETSRRSGASEGRARAGELGALASDKIRAAEPEPAAAPKAAPPLARAAAAPARTAPRRRVAATAARSQKSAPAAQPKRAAQGKTMTIGMIGLGRMGANMSERLLAGGHEVVAFDLNAKARAALAAKGAVPADSLADLVARLPGPRRAIWMMLPAGAPVDETIAALLPSLRPGDILVDGGNSNYRDTVRRAAALKEKGIDYVDVGTSGGVWGKDRGYSLMVGGDDEAVAALRPALATLAPGKRKGWGHVGQSGAGHFAKMVHNGIEYGWMAALGEGLNLVRATPELGLDPAKVAEIWRHGSVISSWLVDLAARALKDDPALADLAPVVPDSGEGQWTVEEALRRKVPATVMSAALFGRYDSQGGGAYGRRVESALRGQFGGHPMARQPAEAP